MALSKKFDEALSFAAEIHRLQTRKGAETPYIGHLLSVAGLVLEHGGNESQAIAALLHDAIEDQADAYGGAEALALNIQDKFGADVRAIVEACTDAWSSNKPEWWERKRAYIDHIADMRSDAVLVSLADKLHNARNILSDLHTHGAIIFERFSTKREGTLWYYNELAHAFSEHHSCPLAFELLRTVNKLTALAEANDKKECPTKGAS